VINDVQMQIHWIILPAAAVIATAASIIVARYAGPPVRTAVRRLFLLFLNITPGGIGIWRREFSTRETAAATWLFVFVLVLLVFVLVS